jgi:hypothetical protein
VIDFIRIILLLALAGAAVTFIGSAAAWWMEDHRRLGRLVRKVLGGKPDGVIVAPGREAAAGFRLTSNQVVVMRRGGANTLLYRLQALLGAELIVDDVVVARAMRDEPRRVLDQVNNEARHVTLRLLFDDPRHPDFSLDLWLPRDAQRRNARTPAAAIREARGWLTRAEAILRRSAPLPVASTAVSGPSASERLEPEAEPALDALPEHDDTEIDLDDEDFEPEAVYEPTPEPIAERKSAAKKPARAKAEAETPELPWDIDPEDGL